MDDAFKDPRYKEARELINAGNTVKVTVEDEIDYDDFLGINNATKNYKRETVVQTIDNIDDLRVFAKYINRLGLTITKVEIIENN